MSNFNYTEYLRNNPLLKPEVKDSLITESQSVGETLNEGVFDKVKEKILKVADKIKNKFSADEIAKMKAAVKKALGKDQLELSDITLDNVKKVANVMKDQLAEGQLEESIGDKIKQFLAGSGMLGGFVAASIGGALGSLSAPLLIGGLIAMIIGGMIQGTIDEEVTEEATSKMKVSELKTKIKEDIMSLLQEEDNSSELENELMADLDEEINEAEEDEEEVEDEEVEVEIEDEIEDEVGGGDADALDPEAGLSQDEQDIQNALKVAYDNAVELGDEKLSKQIGNTITMFTRTRVVGDLN